MKEDWKIDGREGRGYIYIGVCCCRFWDFSLFRFYSLFLFSYQGEIEISFWVIRGNSQGGGGVFFNFRLVYKEGYNGQGKIWQREREV